MIRTLQDTLNGGYKGLFGEVVTEDVYKILGLGFKPTVVIDCGANIGIFSRYARLVFIKALIIAIEPDPNNIADFKLFTEDDNIILIEKAIGTGNVWHGLTAANGSGETYLSSGIGFPKESMAKDESMELSNVETITLSEIVDTYVKPEDKLIIKIDIEGQEHTILFDEKEMNALRRADYICAEIHFYAHTGAEWQEVQDRTHEALKSLESTHNCELDNKNFWASKR